jgi:hypothetical protein
VFANEEEGCRFEKESVVDSDLSDFIDAIPTWLLSACEGVVHNIIGHERTGL